MEDKTQQLFNLLNESKDFKGAFKTPEELTATLSDETKVGALYSLLNESADFKGAFNSIDEFKTSFDIKKKVSSQDALTSASGKEELPLLDQLGQKPQDSLTQPSQSTSAEPVQKTEAFTFPEQAPIIEQPRDATNVNIVQRTSLPTPPETVMRQGRGLKPENLGEYIKAFGGTLNRAFEEVPKLADWIQSTANDAVLQTVYGLPVAQQAQKLRAAGFDYSTALSTDPMQRPFGMIADLLEGWTDKTVGKLVLPQGKEKGGVIGDIATGTANVLPDIAYASVLATAMPEVLALKAIEMATGINLASNFGFEQGIKTAVSKSQQFENGGNLQKVLAPAVGMIEGYAQGYFFANMSTKGNEIGKSIADQVMPKVTTESQAINKAIIQTGGATVSTAGMFGGWGVLDEYRRTGQVSEDTFLSNAGQGMVFGTKDPLRMLLSKGVMAFVGAPRQMINDIAKSDIPAEEHAKNAHEKFDAVANGTSANPESDLASGKLSINTAILKATTEQVLNNKDGLILAVKSSTFETKIKDAIIDKINAIDADNDTKIQATKDITDKISKIDDALSNISGNNSWDDVRKEVESAPLKERKEELKQDAKKVYGIEPKEQPKGEDGKVKEKPKAVQTESSQKFLDDLDNYKLGDKTFKSKEDLTNWLDKNYNENDRFSSVNEEGYLEPNTMKVFNEWYKGNKDRLAKEEMDRIDKENQINTQEGTQNASENRTSDSQLPDQGTSELEQGKGNVDNVGNNEQKGTTQEEVKPVENSMSDSKDIPKGVEEQVKEYKKPGELQKGWEEALPNVPKKEIGTLDDGRKVSIVNGTEMRNKVYTNFTEGGNSHAYPWMNKGDLFIEDVESGEDKVADLIHEAEEDRAMDKLGISYDKAHEEYGLPAEREYRDTGKIPDYLKPIAELLLKEPAEPLQQQENVPREGTIPPKGEGTLLKGTEVPPEQIPPTEPPIRGTVGNQDNQREKGLLNRIKKAKNFKEFGKEIEEKGLTYEQIPNNATAAQVDAMIASRGLRQSEADIRNESLNIPDRIRSMGAVQILDKYRELARDSKDDVEKQDYIKRAVDLADWVDKAGRNWGQAIQALASERVNNILTPDMQLLKAKKMVDSMRQKLLDKNADDIATKGQQMKDINNNVVDQVINSKEYQDLKDRVAELEKKVAEQKANQPKYKARIKQIQADRAKEWDAFFKSSQTSVSAIGLSSEQIEHLGNILSLYAQEGITRAEEILDRFKREYLEKSGQELDDDKAKAWIAAAQKRNEEGGVTADELDNYVEAREKGKQIDQIVKDHYTKPDKSGRSLKEKLIEDGGLKDADAQKIADKAAKKFKDLATPEKKKILKGKNSLVNKIIELTNAGAWEDSDLTDAYARAFGWPKLTDENIKEITRLAELADKAPKGEQKNKAIQALLAYQSAHIKGIDLGDIGNALWYASALSGPHTHTKKMSSELQTVGLETIVTSLYHANHPGDIPHLFSALLRGWGAGYQKALDVLKTGYNPMNKEETPALLEMVDSPIAKVARYVQRMFVAVQQFNAGPSREIRATELAVAKARAERPSATEPDKTDWGRAWDILAKTPEQRVQFEQQAQSEGLKGRDYKRRVWELMEQNRPDDIMEKAEAYSLRTTYMGPPEGLLGMFAHKIGQMTTAASGTIPIPFTKKEYTLYPLKRIVPFTRVLANLGNQMLDYFPPTGLARAGIGSMGVSGMNKYQFSKGYYRKYTPEERGKEAMKGLIGMATIAGIWGLTQLKDKDDKPFVEITANGYGKGDPRNDELKRLGWQPFSLRVGDRWFSWQHSPLALAIGPLGYFDDLSKYHKDESVDDKFAMKVVKCYGNSMTTIFSAPYIEGLNNFFAAIGSGDPNKTGTYISRLASSMGKSVVYPKLIEQTVQTIDNLSKTTEKTSSAWDAQIIRNMPVARNKLNALYNSWGDEVKTPPVFGITKVEHDPFYEYLVKNNLNLAAPRQKEPHYDDTKGILRPMTDDEYADFIHKSGQVIKQRVQSEVIDKKLPQDEAEKVKNNISGDERNIRQICQTKK